MNAVSMTKFALENFKGIKQFSIDFGSENAFVSGKNGTGKTTLYDGYLWLLIGKDSKGRADFQIKPVDAQGREVHYLVTCVEAEFRSAEGRSFVLRKERAENWKQKKGHETPEFSGHIITPMINGVAKTAKEYAAFVEEHLCDMEGIGILSNAFAFNELPWQERRGLLVELTNEDAVDAMLLASPEFEEVSVLLEAYGTPAEAKKALMAQRKKANDELTTVPARIDEVERSMPNTTEEDYAYAERMVKGMQQKLETLEAAESDARKAVEDTMQLAREKSVDLELLRSKMRERAAQLHESADGGRASAQAALASLLRNQQDVEKTMERLEQEAASIKEGIDRKAQETDALRQQHRILRPELARREAPEIAVETNCPVCRQDLPPDTVEEARRAAYAHWEEEESRRIARVEREANEIVARGKANNQAMEEDAARLDAVNQRLLEEHTLLATILEKIEDQRLTLDSLPDSEVDVSADAAYCALEQQAAGLQSEIDAMKSPEIQNTVYEARKREIRQVLDDSKAVLAQRARVEEAKLRLEELNARRRELGQTVATLEGQISAIERFVAERCKALEASINHLFPTVRWKLFEAQINGGIADTCTCLVQGVPFTDANNAARINAGLEIISVLSEAWAVSIPIFVDNAESVNEIRPVQGQLIGLVVTHGEQLQIEPAALTA